ncbi:cytochrome b-245 light chain-like [Dysidea avara]|uniref:cytochrome b-245 light chain-like n=1 Tax=Dysidea avara TaxID=196820 RepID=UPI003321E51D
MSAAEYKVSDAGSWESTRKRLAMKSAFYSPFFRIEWAMWANEQALYGGLITFFGALFGATMTFIEGDTLPSRYGFYSRYIVLALSPIIVFVEYPRSNRRNNKRTPERLLQGFISPIIHFTRLLGRNYLIRCVVLWAFSIPCFFLLSTVFGGMCLVLAGILYFIAAVLGEQWRPISLKWGPGSSKGEEEVISNTRAGPTTLSAPPSKPPPRLPNTISAPPDRPPPRPNVA